MNKTILKLSVAMMIIHSFAFPPSAYAVIPPDFIFTIGSQIAQVFSLIVIFLTAVFGTFFQFFKAQFYTIKHKKIVLFGIIIFIIGLSLGGAYYYDTKNQQAEYEKWLEESQRQNEIFKESQEIETAEHNENPVAKIEKNNEKESFADPRNKIDLEKDDADIIDTSSSNLITKVNTENKLEIFIKNYYGNISDGQLDEAYAVSKKSASLETFKSWYQDTTRISIDKFTNIDEQNASLELTLFEGEKFTVYAVLMTVRLENNIPMQIIDSKVKALSQGKVENNEISFEDTSTTEEYSFYEKNKNTNIVISNKDLDKTVKSNLDNYIILDARENIEVENGYFPNSTHIRFADLKAGKWIELPSDKFVYVYCWSGIRGKEVAEFLRTKKIVASSFEEGANGWFNFEGDWIGNIKFGEKYTDKRYSIVFSTDEVKKYVSEGVSLVDARQPYKYEKSHIAGSFNIATMYIPSLDYEKSFSQVPANSKVITICDDYVNCFDAKVTGVELERRGYQFLGRYNKPWEYGK